MIAIGRALFCSTKNDALCAAFFANPAGLARAGRRKAEHEAELSAVRKRLLVEIQNDRG
jgi:hypothetical protein